MQATSSAERPPKLDRFECLSCGTLVEVPHKRGEKRDGR